jgi:hypothetical protein
LPFHWGLPPMVVSVPAFLGLGVQPKRVLDTRGQGCQYFDIHGASAPRRR